MLSPGILAYWKTRRVISAKIAICSHSVWKYITPRVIWNPALCMKLLNVGFRAPWEMTKCWSVVNWRLSKVANRWQRNAVISKSDASASVKMLREESSSDYSGYRMASCKPCLLGGVIWFRWPGHSCKNTDRRTTFVWAQLIAGFCTRAFGCKLPAK